jgi:uncharacterized protein YegP (UPF0339 family)
VTTSSTYKRAIYVELCKGQGVQPWFLRLVGSNGETLAVSEGYLSKWNVQRAAKKNFPGVRMVDET